LVYLISPGQETHWYIQYVQEYVGGVSAVSHPPLLYTPSQTHYLPTTLPLDVTHSKLLNASLNKIDLIQR